MWYIFCSRKVLVVKCYELVKVLHVFSQEMTVCLTLEEILERLEGDVCDLFFFGRVQ